MKHGTEADKRRAEISKIYHNKKGAAQECKIKLSVNIPINSALLFLYF